MQPGFDYVGVNVGFICHDGKGKILMHLRSPKNRDEHLTWDCGGGQVEFGESLADAVAREVREEYGCTAIQIDHLAQLEMFREHEGRATHWLANIYAVLVNPSEARIMEPDKNMENRWYGIDNLPQPLHPAPAYILKDHTEKLKKIIHHAR